MKNLKFKTYNSFKKMEDVEDKGILYIEGYASKAYDNGKPVIDYDGELVETSGFDLTTCTTLLFNHNHGEYAVGKCLLSHRPDGVYLKGEIHEAMNSEVYYAVKHGIMTDFSIGFSASDYEYREIDGEDVLTFTEGFVFETSICNVIGANPQAKIEISKSLEHDKRAVEVLGWLKDSTSEVRLDSEINVKSMIQDGKCVGFTCSIDELKKANPNQACACEKGNMNKSIQEIVKGLTFEDTANEVWNQYEMLSHYMGILTNTIEDNFFETLWAEDMNGEDAKANILATIQSFILKLDELDVLKNPIVGVEKGKQEEMIIKSKEAEEVVEAPATEGQEEISTEEVVEETAESTEEESDKETSNSESLEGNEVSTEENEQAQETSNVEVEEVEAEPKLVGNAQTTIGYLSTLDIEELSVEEIEALYDTADSIMEKIEVYVREDLSGEED